jgi:hypothetical protein
MTRQMPASDGGKYKFGFMPFFGVMFLFALAGCAPQNPPKNAGSVFSINGSVISIDLVSPMLKYLEISQISDSHLEKRNLQAVGQIIALANDSDELRGSQISWVELDPEISRSLGLHFDNQMKVPVGQAYGVVSVPYEYMGQLKRYEGVAISRYGLLKSVVSGMVISILPTKANGVVLPGEPVQVVFEIPHGEDLYPGTNCEVDFPVSAGRPVTVPSTAVLHEGRQEYLLQELEPGRYRPQPVYILDTMQDSVLVIGNIKAGEKIISRGAILLKPLLHDVLRAAHPFAATSTGENTP